MRTYRGIQYKSKVDVCSKLNINPNVISIYDLHTPEQIIDYHLDIGFPIKRKSYKDYIWTTFEELAEKLSMPLEELQEIGYVEAINSRIVREAKNYYKGVSWDTQTELCNKLGVCSDYFSNVNAYPTREAIDRYRKGLPINYMESGSYRGIVWSSHEELAKKLNISVSIIKSVGCRRAINNYFSKTYDVPNGKSGSYKQISWKSYKELSTLIGCPVTFIYNRTAEEAIDVYWRKVEIQNLINKINKGGSYKSVSWVSVKDLCNQLMVEPNYFENANAYSVEEAIDMHLNGDIVTIQESGEYRNFTWTSYASLSRQLKCKPSTLKLLGCKYAIDLFIEKNIGIV